jgi:translation initiation factor IF-1
MPKNTKGGNKAKKQKNSTFVKKERDPPLPSEEELSHIAKIVGVMGDCRFKCKIVNSNGVQPNEIMVHLGGKARKFGRITTASYVKISLREFEENKGDILYTYNGTDMDYLISNGYIKEVTSQNKEEEIIFCDVIDNNGKIEESNEVDLSFI